MNSISKQPESTEAGQVSGHLRWFLVLAVGLIILGWLDLFVPLVSVSSHAVQNMIGILLVLGGIMYIAHTFQWQMSERVIPGLAIGILYIIFGLLLQAPAVRAVFTVTLLLGTFFLMEGILKIAQSVRTRPSSGWGWMFFSGVVSVILALFIWTANSSTLFRTIGLIVGINLLTSGFSLLMIGLTVRSAIRAGERFCIGGECFEA